MQGTIVLEAQTDVNDDAQEMAEIEAWLVKEEAPTMDQAQVDEHLRILTTSPNRVSDNSIDDDHTVARQVQGTRPVCSKTGNYPRLPDFVSKLTGILFTPTASLVTVLTPLSRGSL